LSHLEVDLSVAQPREPARGGRGVGAPAQVVLRPRVVEVPLGAARLAAQKQDPGTHGGREVRDEQLLDEHLRLRALLALDESAREAKDERPAPRRAPPLEAASAPAGPPEAGGEHPEGQPRRSPGPPRTGAR